MNNNYILCLCPTEKLRRKDLEVSRALEEKHRLIAEILNMDDASDFDHIAEVAELRLDDAEKAQQQQDDAEDSQQRGEKDAREVLLAALAQGRWMAFMLLLLVLLFYCIRWF